MKLLSKLVNLTGLMHNGAVSSTHKRIPSDEVNNAIEQVVDGIYPNIRYFPGYQKILNNCVATSLTHIDDLVDTISEALLISSKSFATDSHVSAFFSTISNMQEIFSDSIELRDFFSEPVNGNLDEVYGLLCINETEKTVFTMELHEDIIQRDVMRTALNFSEHKILSPASSEAEVRLGLKQCIFDGLITHALQQIVELEQKKKGLEKQRFVLNAKLKSRQSEGGGLSKMLASVTENIQPADIEQQLSENEKQLSKLPATWDAPGYYLEIIKDTLSRPEKFICLSRKSFNITSMGIINSDNPSQLSNTIHFNEILIANVLKRVIAIVRYPRNEMLARKGFYLK